MKVLLCVPVWCEHDDGFREPEGDVVVGSAYPAVGFGMVLCDKKVWQVKRIEGNPEHEWPKVICCPATRGGYGQYE